MQSAMIDPTATATATAGSGATTKGPSNTLGKDAFLKLLVAQLKHQDPTSAQDPNAMVAQMAQFSSLEQQQNTNSLLTGMQGQMSAMFQSQSSSLLGKNVQVTSSSMDLTGGKATMGLSLPAAANVTLTVQNATGQAVAILPQGALNAGSQVVKWDGKGTTGNKLPDGTYTVAIAATGADGKPVSANTTSNATVTAVGFSNGVMTITAGGQQYPLSAINQVAS